MPESWRSEGFDQRIGDILGLVDEVRRLREQGCRLRAVPMHPDEARDVVGTLRSGT